MAAELFHRNLQTLFDSVLAGTHIGSSVVKLEHDAPSRLCQIQLSQNDECRATALRLFPNKFNMRGKFLGSLEPDARPLLKSSRPDSNIVYANSHATVGWLQKGEKLTKCISAPGVEYRELYGFNRKLEELLLQAGSNLLYIVYKHGMLKYIVLSSATRREEFTFYENGSLKRKMVLESVDAEGDLRGITSYYYLPGVPQHVGAVENVRARYETTYSRTAMKNHQPKREEYVGLCIDYQPDGSVLEI